MDKNILIILIGRCFRAFGFGAITLIFIQFLVEKNFDEYQIGILQSFIFIGDIAVSMILNFNAERIGKKWVLVIGSLLKVVANIVYNWSDSFVVLAIAGALGSISITGA